MVLVSGLEETQGWVTALNLLRACCFQFLASGIPIKETVDSKTPVG
jgi:hypothetical protein